MIHLNNLNGIGRRECNEKITVLSQMFTTVKHWYTDIDSLTTDECRLESISFVHVTEDGNVLEDSLESVSETNV